MPVALSIPHTLAVITRCWRRAEAAARWNIRVKHHDPDEEFITRLFAGELSYQLRLASKDDRIATAFLEDLSEAFPWSASCDELSVIASDLAANVSYHKRHVERRTGGDFGLTITRPDVEFWSPGAWTNEGTYTVLPNYRRGLLCQAKLKHQTGWGRLSDNQVKVLPAHLAYLALMLYSFEDTHRTRLNPFRWQSCAGGSIQLVRKWLNRGLFPRVQNSDSLIGDLGRGTIGTDDPEILEKVIQPNGAPRFQIVLDWPENKRPPEHQTVFLASKVNQYLDEPAQIIQTMWG